MSVSAINLQAFHEEPNFWPGPVGLEPTTHGLEAGSYIFSLVLTSHNAELILMSCWDLIPKESLNFRAILRKSGIDDHVAKNLKRLFVIQIFFREFNVTTEA
jgi:hypothetical protein